MEIHSVLPISLYLRDGRELSKSSAQLGGSKQQLFETFSQLEYLSWCTTAECEPYLCINPNSAQTAISWQVNQNRQREL